MQQTTNGSDRKFLTIPWYGADLTVWYLDCRVKAECLGREASFA